jgi:hypothetical protein
MGLYAVARRLSAQIGKFGVIVTPNLPIGIFAAVWNFASLRVV